MGRIWSPSPLFLVSPKTCPTPWLAVTRADTRAVLECSWALHMIDKHAPLLLIICLKDELAALILWVIMKKILSNTLTSRLVLTDFHGVFSHILSFQSHFSQHKIVNKNLALKCCCCNGSIKEMVLQLLSP